MPLVEARLIGDDGDEAPWDGESTGELEVRGPWIAADYYEDPSGRDKFHDGWLRTGDIASIDDKGFVKISDRAKDVIKDRKSTRLNSSHANISYAVFCLKKKKIMHIYTYK